MITTIILILILCLVAATEYSTFRTGVPTLASFPASRRKMIDVLLARAAAHQGPAPFTILDLGSGNGQLVTKIARALPDARVTGIEISFVPWAISAIRRALLGPKNVIFRRVDFWTYDCSTTDAMVIYLTGKIMERVSQKLRAELKPGATVITNEIPLQDGWEPVETIETGFLNMKIFVYRA